MSNGPSNPIVGFILGILCLAGGYYVWQHVGKPIRARAAASVKWPVTDGQITRSNLIREDPKRDKKAMFSMDIAYDYMLDGKKFEGTRVWFGDQFSSSAPEHFQAAVHRYPVGKGVKVFYDPAETSESVLEPGSNWSASIWYLVGIGLMVFGGLALGSSAFFLAAVVALFTGGGGSRTESDDFDRPLSSRATEHRRPDDDDGDGIEIV